MQERWTITAVGGNIKARPDNNQPFFLIVSVEDANGAPVLALVRENFNLAVEVAGSGLSFSESFVVSPARLPGVYVFQVVPYPGHTWLRGLFVFSIAVQSQAARGQTLCSSVLN